MGDRFGNLSHGLRLSAAAGGETAALTGQAAKVEREIDERVAGLYGVEVCGRASE